MRVASAPRAPGRPAPGPASALPDLSAPQPIEPLPPASDGVELTRLLALARLTAPQALEIAAAVLAEAATRSEDERGNADRDPGGISPVVVVGDDGRVVIGPPPDGTHNGRPTAAGPAVAVVLAQVAAAARIRAPRADPAAEELLDALDRAVTELPVAGVAVVAPMLQEAAAAIDRPVVRAELAALVSAVRDAVGSASGGGPGGAAPTVVRSAPSPRQAGRETRTAGRRIGAWLLSVLVLSSVVVLEVVLLRDEIATDIGVLLDAGRSGSTQAAGPEADGLPIEPPAPAAAGDVASVDLRPMGRCTPDARCTVRLLVRLVPGAERQVVSWSYRLIDRCTGATDTAAGGSVAVPAGGDQAVAVDAVSLPKVQAVAVVAVTETPAAAASAPFFVGSCLPEQAG